MRSLILLAISLTYILLPSETQAHGGGLDAKGCHTERKTGNYHCHGGAPSTGGGGVNFSGGSGGGRGTMYVAPAYTQPPRRSQPKPVSPPVAGAASLISVGDGDTIRVTASNGQKATIRLACIDAPESAQGQSGADATQALKTILSVGPLEIKPQTVDKYGRTVAEVFSNGRNINIEMVRLGMAYVYRQYLGGCDEAAYLNAESQAEKFRQGVWRWGNEVKPWEFRKGK